MTPAPELVPYQHPTTGFRLSLPDGWERVEDTSGIALAAIEPERDPWFRANLVITIEELAPATDLAAWQETALALMRQMLTDFHLLDSTEADVAGLPARRTLAHHRTETEHVINSVTLEQWVVIDRRLGYTLTGSVASLEYDELADLFASVASSFHPDPEYTP